MTIILDASDKPVPVPPAIIDGELLERGSDAWIRRELARAARGCCCISLGHPNSRLPLRVIVTDDPRYTHRIDFWHAGRLQGSIVNLYK